MIWVGTSGFQYPAWKGSFYPEKLPTAEMLSYYAQHFPTTEINQTFRRLPSDQAVANWLDQTPARFRFTLKAPQKITHLRRLKNCRGDLEALVSCARKLGRKSGALLFQLPPNFKCDLPRLADFLAALPRKSRAAFEFRHDSWFTDAVFETLRKHHAALCIADTEDLTTPSVFTTSLGYFRLRRDNYRPRELARWAKLMTDNSSRLKEVYVYFKHEDTGTGPRLAGRLIKMLSR